MRSLNLKALALWAWRSAVLRWAFLALYQPAVVPLLADMRRNSLQMVEGCTPICWTIFLTPTRLHEGLKSIPLFKAELGVVFRHRQSKDCTTWSNDKMPSKAYYRLFLKITLIS